MRQFLTQLRGRYELKKNISLHLQRIPQFAPPHHIKKRSSSLFSVVFVTAADHGSDLNINSHSVLWQIFLTWLSHDTSNEQLSISFQSSVCREKVLKTRLRHIVFVGHPSFMRGKEREREWFKCLLKPNDALLVYLANKNACCK